MATSAAWRREPASPEERSGLMGPDEEEGAGVGSASASEALEALQKQKCRQDEMLDELFHSTRSLNIKAQKIHEEISGQDGMIEDLDNELNQAKDNVDSVMFRLKEFAKRQGGMSSCAVICVLSIILLVLIILIIMGV